MKATAFMHPHTTFGTRHMHTPRCLIAAAAAAAFALCSGAQAASVTLSGQIGFHNDVVHIDVRLLSAASNLRIWSDSWLSGLNFDPTAAFWRASGADYTLLAQVDDDDTVAAGQGFYDTGFSFPSLPAGSYRLTLAAAVNAANGSLLSQGFLYDTQTPIALRDWNQPTYDPNANDQKCGFWRLTLDGVDAANRVHEPASWTLVGLALAALALRRRPAATV
jgi:hypothetical protein